MEDITCSVFIETVYKFILSVMFSLSPCTVYDFSMLILGLMRCFYYFIRLKMIHLNHSHV